MMRVNQCATANHRLAGQSDGSDNLSATLAADRAFPAAVAELGSLGPKMKIVWKRIEAWLSTNAPEVLRGLNPPATRSQISDVEAALGITFPQDLVDTFLIHNGQASDTPWLLDGWEFMSVERIVDEWKVWKDLLDGGDFKESNSDSDGHTVTDWWSPLWIPLTYDGAGNHHCLDLKPGRLGKMGQIIRMWHDDAARDLVAPSYREWLTGLANDFEAGRYELSDEYGGIVERGS